ncbi:S8 family serine peptidase [Pontibacter sp. E15-1]|uniref:S8 family serine peptidase n=1 Tax=Pontibacter sp. E15-1 TaxID=2919918 RepID=UPI001F4FE54A|nr:S8 family serine peptidase [Pontibacter sp. E15-1]MCJ8163686.1 S8 family serine peptidase [Pontibacter sp. E15-1]
MRRLLFSLGMLYCTVLSVFGQGGSQAAEEQKRLVYFTDKANTPFSISQPQDFLSAKALERRQRQQIPLSVRDLPVDPAYVTAVQNEGVRVLYTSRWFNAAVVQCSAQKLQEIEALPFVKKTRTLNRIATPATELKRKYLQEMEALPYTSNVALGQGDYGLAFHQANMLGATELHAAGYTGEGMTIAVLDAGFPEVNTLAAFSHLFQEKKIRGTFDFVQKGQDVYGANAHGTAVLSTMAAYAPGQMIGTAYAANYLLLRTEDAASEHHVEEINWLLAAEYADSAGADVINSSLGYTTFDSPSVSYTYQDLDGNTTLVARAADMAASTGMLVVVSAGNEGNKPWQYIASPADADSVLTVGAVDSLGIKAGFSSFGPSADGQLKPDVVALGKNAYVLSSAGEVIKSNGTSFSGPIMAGFAACLWQTNLGRTNIQLIDQIRQSGSNAAMPDSAVGYGLPTYGKTLNALPEAPLPGHAYITNPVRDQPLVLALSQELWSQPMEVQILDVTGKQLAHQRFASAQREQVLQLAPHQLKAGLYFCRVRSGNRVLTLRFVKL